MDARTKPRRVLLIGMMGSGKSTVGRLLSERTGWPYYDNDVLLERAHGATARELLADAGEAELREAEAAALRHGLSESPPCILGAAGGTILDATNRAVMGDAAIVVWLNASPETLATRALGAAHRPWIQSDALGWMRSTLEERRPLYESVADLTVATDARTSESVASEIADWLANLAEGPRD